MRSFFRDLDFSRTRRLSPIPNKGVIFRKEREADDVGVLCDIGVEWRGSYIFVVTRKVSTLSLVVIRTFYIEYSWINGPYISVHSGL